MQEATNRTHRLIALLLFVLTAALYLQTVAPGLLDGDAGEFQFAAWRLGLAHPTGYPFYLVLGSLWQHALALVGVSPASALNAFSAWIGAGAVALLYLLMTRWLAGPARLGRGVALFTALLLAVNPTFWSQNLIAEVYTLHVLFLLLILWVAHGQPPARQQPQSPQQFARTTITLAFLTGLALTHHAMILWLLPGLALVLTLADRHWWRAPRRWLALLGVGALPFLLYLYIPLRSGPQASPWYHQRLGDGLLTLYENTPAAFFNFISGRSIAVGFYDWPRAWANLDQAWLLWQLHFTWVGLALAGWGLFALFWQRQWAVLALTLPYALLQQVFNLFYAIGDILVYYIPLYLMATIWAGFGVHALITGTDALRKNPAPTSGVEPGNLEQARRGNSPPATLSILFLCLCFLLPLGLLREYYPQLDQSSAHGARTQWEAILAAQPPADAILVSDDRNKMVPLFYLQAVEGRGQGLTGLFPLIKPDEHFADIGATVATALAAGQQPVYLIKEMPGLEVKFTVEPATQPLMRVRGLAAATAPEQPLDLPFGPLHLLGYDWHADGAETEIALHWAVREALASDYTTTVQLFDAAGEKVTQDDRPPGGVYYPTSRWKVGETLVERHRLTIPAERQVVELLIDLYDPSGQGADWGEPLRIPLPTITPP